MVCMRVEDLLFGLIVLVLLSFLSGIAFILYPEAPTDKDQKDGEQS